MSLVGKLIVAALSVIVAFVLLLRLAEYTWGLTLLVLLPFIGAAAILAPGRRDD